MILASLPLEPREPGLYTLAGYVLDRDYDVLRIACSRARLPESDDALGYMLLEGLLRHEDREVWCVIGGGAINGGISKGRLAVVSDAAYMQAGPYPKGLKLRASLTILWQPVTTDLRIQAL